MSKIFKDIKARKPHYDKLKDCNHDLIKRLKLTLKLKRPTIWKIYIEKNIFNWGLKQAIFFPAIKDAIYNNTAIKKNLNL